MAAIRLLKKHHQDAIVEAEKVIDEYIKAFKDPKTPKTYLDLKAVQVFYYIWSEELFTNAMNRKTIETRRKLEAMNKYGMAARKQAEKYYQYKCFLETVNHDHAIFLGRSFKMLITSGAVAGLPIPLSTSYTFSSCSN